MVLIIQLVEIEEEKKKFNHLFDPLTSVPKIGTKNKKNKVIKKR